MLTGYNKAQGFGIQERIRPPHRRDAYTTARFQSGITQPTHVSIVRPHRCLITAQALIQWSDDTQCYCPRSSVNNLPPKIIPEVNPNRTARPAIFTFGIGEGLNDLAITVSSVKQIANVDRDSGFFI